MFKDGLAVKPYYHTKLELIGRLGKKRNTGPFIFNIGALSWATSFDYTDLYMLKHV